MMKWQPFLRQWSRELMKSSLADRVEPPPESPDWLGYAPAGEDEIVEVEQRLGMMLPPSYGSFLRTSNGWRRTTFAIGRLRPAREVNWFRVENEHWADVYGDHGSDLPDEEYYEYDRHAELHHRAEHMQSLVQISDVEDGVYLLNPQAVTPDGEWEAWFFANWIPGARRYPSFAHLMLAQYESFAQTEKLPASSRRLPKLKTPGPDVPRVPAERVTRIAKAASLERLIDEMAAADAKVRSLAVRTFFGKGKGRPRAQRRPDLIEPLTRLFYASSDAHVRAACVHGLKEFAADDAAPAPLLDALSDPDPSVVLQGMFALHYFRNPAGLEPLCRFIESRVNLLYNETAISHLAQMRDERAVPTLLGVLLDVNMAFPQGIGSAGLALGQCGRKGFDALVAALRHHDPRVRHAAVVGIDCSGDPHAEAYLDQMTNDPDDSVRQRAKTRVGDMYRRLMGND